MDCNLGERIVDKFTKLSKIGFSKDCFIADFFRLSGTKFASRMAGSVLAIKSKHFMDFFSSCSTTRKATRRFTF